MEYGANSQVCRSCRKAKDIGLFPHILKNGGYKPLKICRKCYNDRARRRNKQAKETKKQKRISGVVTALRENKIEAPHVSELAAAMMKQAGGVGKFSESWWRQVEATLGSDASPRTKLEAFNSVAKLVGVSTQNRMTAPDVFDLSNEDLERELANCLKQMDDAKVILSDGPLEGSEDAIEVEVDNAGP